MVQHTKDQPAKQYGMAGKDIEKKKVEGKEG